MMSCEGKRDRPQTEIDAVVSVVKPRDSAASRLPEKYQIKKEKKSLSRSASCHPHAGLRTMGFPPPEGAGHTRRVLSLLPDPGLRSEYIRDSRGIQGTLLIWCHFAGIRGFEPLKIFPQVQDSRMTLCLGKNWMIFLVGRRG
uniref:Uncharacterized protein n=1 Tax=Pipistrellus kuhlii TaxID=59472 RepID=A0A7J7RFE2_PIPKU|nr:hypothetical protein mPipKuh1_010564 [Pipistrellus kuhlii]